MNEKLWKPLNKGINTLYQFLKHDIPLARADLLFTIAGQNSVNLPQHTFERTHNFVGNIVSPQNNKYK
ncbi:MAG: hypothetical protein ACYSR0_12700, partial [Planctomycetota bacterium]